MELDKFNNGYFLIIFFIDSVVPKVKTFKKYTPLGESKRYFKSDGRIEKETRFYISSHKADARKINEAIRNHWSVENCLHWMLDVVFAEDSSRRRTGNSATNFNIISKIALGLIERSPYKNKSKRQRRFKAGFDPEFREKVLNL